MTKFFEYDTIYVINTLKIGIGSGYLNRKFNITGMTCSACSSHVDKCVRSLDGIQNVNVNLLKNSMTVEYNEAVITENDIIKAVESGGYGASVAGEKKEKTSVDTNEASVKKRLIVSIAFLIPLMYISMGHMWHFPFLSFFDDVKNAGIFAFTQLLLTLPVLVVNRKFFTNGFKMLIKGSPNMDTLIAIGSGTSFVYGICAIYVILYALANNNTHLAHEYMMNLYFEGAAMILTLITLGKFFEARAKGKTTEEIEKLMDLTPKTATVVRNGEEITIPTEEVVIGDVVVVRAGQTIPVDGEIVEGGGSVDESAITGESVGVEKTINSKVVGATLLQSGYIEIKVEKTGGDTTLAQIIQLVEEASSSKAPIAKLADRVSAIFVPAVILISIITLIVWLCLGYDLSFALSMAVSVLVISCPCALGLATPTAIMVGTGNGARMGILIKNAEALENTHKINTVVLDKTGTVTEGKMSVTDIIPNAVSQEELLKIAASIEIKSSHPLSKAICKKAEGMDLYEVTDFEQIEGGGIKGKLNEETVFAGNYKMMMQNNISVTQNSCLADSGKTLLYFAKNNEFIGIIAIRDTIKKSSKNAISQLYKMGLDVIMLTGDNKKTAKAICDEVGISNVIAEVLPQDKEKEIRRLQQEGKRVAMVGDGINDAPALVRADVGIAIGGGTDIAIDSADFVLLNSDLTSVASSIKLSKSVIKNIKENLFWAFIYNILGIPVAAGVLYLPLGVKLNPMIAAAAMSLSSVFVVSNALRLRFFNKKTNTPIKKEEENKMVIKINGMMCPHCTLRVQEALNAIDGVSAEVTLDNGGQAAITLSKDVSVDLIKKTIVEAGYKVVD